MAILTWQNVTAPDFSSSQSGIRTAGDFFNRAVQNGEDIISGLRAAEAVKKAEAQANADRLLTQQYLTAQDPRAISEMLARGIDKKADGTQLVDPSQVNAEMLRRYAAQQQQLQASALAEQQRLAAENARKTSYAAGQIFDKYAPLATKDPTQALQRAQQELGALNLPVNDARAIIKDLNSLYRDPATLMRAQAERRAVGLREQDQQIQAAAAQFADRLRNLKDPGAFRELYFKGPSISGMTKFDPLIRQRAFDLLYQKDPRVAEYLNTTSDFGQSRQDAEEMAALSAETALAAGSGSRGKNKSKESKPAEMVTPALPPESQRLPESAPVYQAVERFKAAKGNTNTESSLDSEKQSFLEILRSTKGGTDNVHEAVLKEIANRKKLLGEKSVAEIDVPELERNVQLVKDASKGKFNADAAVKLYISSLKPDTWFSFQDAIPGYDMPNFWEDSAVADKAARFYDFAATEYPGFAEADRTTKDIDRLLKQYIALEQKVRHDETIARMPVGAQAEGHAPNRLANKTALETLRTEILKAARGGQ